ncbi:MFS transporter [Kribbia dieselivorans]|uniref:MFS transporter n=1 Tax=Kribbia dieselivorans TaxID=331526 RepID=UPI0008386161|nr:MFS transporter [Kribbia dieselivorans]
MTDTATRFGITRFWDDLPTAGRWLLTTTIVQTLGRGMVLPFVLIYMTQVRGASLDTAGYLMAAIAVAAVAVTVPTGYLIDHLGARAVVMGGTIAMIAGAVMFAFATSVPALLVASLLVGAAQGSSFPAFHSFIAQIVDGEARTQFFGLNFALVNLGMGVGGLIGGLFVDISRPWTFTAVFIAEAVFMLFPLAVLLGPLRRAGGGYGAGGRVTSDGLESRPNDAPAPTYLNVLRRPAVLWISVVGVLTSFVGYGQFESGVPAFAVDIAGVSTRTLGFGFAVNTFVIVALQFAVMRWISGHRRTRMLLLMTAIWGLSWVSLAASGLLPDSWLAVLGVVGFFAIFALGETLLQATTPAIVNDLATDHERGRYNAINAAAYQSGAILGPAFAGAALHHGGARAGTSARCWSGASCWRWPWWPSSGISTRSPTGATRP